jgi:hypothetical protein
MIQQQARTDTTAYYENLIHEDASIRETWMAITIAHQDFQPVMFQRRDRSGEALNPKERTPRHNT